MSDLTIQTPTTGLQDTGPLTESCDVAVIGAGPAGLAAASELRRLGVPRVLVLEREEQAGGIPRHCGHPPFGLLSHKRILTGPAYARALVRSAREAGVEIRLKTTVLGLHRGGRLSLLTPEGPCTLQAQRVLIATGARETPRAARLVPGQRALGVMNTGALQAMVYLKNLVPFRRPVIAGSELVSFSALITCRRAGIRPIAMIEENARPTVRWPLHYAHILFGVPLHLNSSIRDICGNDRVRMVTICKPDGRTTQVECDGVLFTGRFTPESSLARLSHLSIDPGTGGPQVDQFGRCSDPAYFAAGNLLRPVETHEWCWREGRKCALFLKQALEGALPSPGGEIPVQVKAPFRYVLPQRLTPGVVHADGLYFQLRVDKPVKGRLCLVADGKVIHAQVLNAIPEQRILVQVPKELSEKTYKSVTFRIMY